MSVFRVKFVVKFPQCIQDLLHAARWCNQVCDTEMIRTWFLSKTAAWNRHDACLVYHFHAVKEVRLFTLCLSFLNEFLRKVDLWECIHRALDFRASYILHRIKGIRQKLSTFF